MPKALMTTIRMTAVLGIVVLIILGLLAVLKVFPREELIEMAKTAFLVLGIFAAGSIAISGVTGDWGGASEDSEP